MTWGRYGNSREVHSADTFGVAHYWRHNFQWELAPVANDSAGHRQVNVVYPNGADFTFNQSRYAVSPDREVMIPTVMKKVGYATASVGKWGQI
jgi:hypothetical protein